MWLVRIIGYQATNLRAFIKPRFQETESRILLKASINSNVDHGNVHWPVMVNFC